jgi:hypothetical protein
LRIVLGIIALALIVAIVSVATRGARLSNCEHRATLNIAIGNVVYRAPPELRPILMPDKWQDLSCAAPRGKLIVESDVIFSRPQSDSEWVALWPKGLVLIHIQKTRSEVGATSDKSTPPVLVPSPENNNRRYVSDISLIQGSVVTMTKVGDVNSAPVYWVRANFSNNSVDFQAVGQSDGPSSVLPTIRAVDSLLSALRHHG